jgi:hypothetical protein
MCSYIIKLSSKNIVAVMTTADADDDDDNDNNIIHNIYAILSTKNLDVARIRAPKQEPNMITYESICILWFLHENILPK